MSLSLHRAAVLDEPSPRRPDACPVEDWLEFLGHRWNALILWHLSTGPKRHRDLLACLPGISAKVLSERLDGLEGRGLLLRMPRPTFPRVVVYQLTFRGERLVLILDSIEIWARDG